jgi:glycerophosphoryl diester phosphodiesterase
VCLTRDGALACLHDAYLPLGTTLTGWAHERSVADVLAGRLLDGEGRATAERPLLVDEMLDLVPPRLTVQVDVKAHADPALARRTVDALAAVLARRPDAGRVEVLSFHAAAVEQAVGHGLAGRLVIWADYAPAALARWASDVALRGVCVEHFLLGQPLVAAMRDAGQSVTTGTVNHAAVAERAIPYAPDAVTTDRPHQLAAELAEWRLLAA